MTSRHGTKNDREKFKADMERRDQPCEQVSVRVEEGMWLPYCATHEKPWGKCEVKAG